MKRRAANLTALINSGRFEFMDAMDYLRATIRTTPKASLEYQVWHYSPRLSYYNIYTSKWAAYREAINPRYWKCVTVVTARPKA